MATKRRAFFTFNRKIFITTFLLIILSSAVISVISLRGFEKEILPEMDKKAVTLSGSILSVIIKTVDYGVPFNSVNGMDEYFESILKDNPEVRYIFISDTDRVIRYYSGFRLNRDELESISKNISQGKEETRTISVADYHNTSAPVIVNGQVLGHLVIGIDKKFIHNRTLDIIYDIITVIIVSLLISFEMVLFLVNYAIMTPIKSINNMLMRARDGDFSQTDDIKSGNEIGNFIAVYNTLLDKINRSFFSLKEKAVQLQGSIADTVKDRIEKLESSYKFRVKDETRDTQQANLIFIRPPLFLLIFADSLSLSFFPFFVRELYTPVPGISENIVIGLPISIFMLFWAFSLPYAGAWSDRVGRRKPIIIGAILTSAGLVLTGFAQSMYDLLLWRSLTAVGYGTVYITCQGYITDNTTSANRTRGMAMFLAGFFSGSLCGSAIGGILVDRIGFRMTFMLSAVVSLISALFVARLLIEPKKGEAVKKKKMQLADFRLVLSNKRFLAITLFSSIPAKICLTGFLYYTAPMFLKQLGNTQSSIGRVLMSYGLMMVFVSPMVGNIADRFKCRRIFTNMGGLMSGLGLLMVLFWNTTPGVLVSIAVLGISHSIQVSSQMSLITDDCVNEGGKIGMATVVSIYRLIERIGNISGPIIAGLFIAFMGTAYGEMNSFPYAIAAIGILTILSSITFMIFYSILDWKDKKNDTAYAGN